MQYDSMTLVLEKEWWARTELESEPKKPKFDQGFEPGLSARELFLLPLAPPSDILSTLMKTSNPKMRICSVHFSSCLIFQYLSFLSRVKGSLGRIGSRGCCGGSNTSFAQRWKDLFQYFRCYEKQVSKYLSILLKWFVWSDTSFNISGPFN